MPEQATALVISLSRGHLDVVRLLLTRGANPNLGRAIIKGLNITNRAARAEAVGLLVAHGVDLNQVFPPFGDLTKAFTALDWVAGDAIMAKYLRQHGAITLAELNARDGHTARS